MINSNANSNRNRITVTEFLSLLLPAFVTNLQERLAVARINRDKIIEECAAVSKSYREQQQADREAQAILRKRARHWADAPLAIPAFRQPELPPKPIKALPKPNRVKVSAIAPVGNRCQSPICNRVLKGRRGKKFCSHVETGIVGYQDCKNAWHVSNR